MKNEKVFQEIWFRNSESWDGLVTANGDIIKIISSGFGHTDHGPDFKNAHIKIGQTEWFGNIELHLRTSDWFRHGHDKDPMYQNVILHVVWIHDHNSFDVSPVLELSKYLADYHNHQEGVQGLFELPCADGAIKDIESVKLFLEQWVIKRFERKVEKILDNIHEKRGNIEQVAWELLTRTFGYKVNADCFEEVAKTISFDFIRNYTGDIYSLEALILGQAGLLPPNPKDDYIKSLIARYTHLKWKHKLLKTHSTPVFLRMRPINFPTIRLVQLASLFSEYENFFEKFISCKSIDECKEIFSVKTSTYWLDHYLPDRVSKKVPKRIGEQLIHLVIVNVLIPLRLAIKKRNGKGDWHEMDLNWLRILQPENSSTIRSFQTAGIYPSNGFESQALLELYQTKCKSNDCDGCPFNPVKPEFTN